MSNVNTAQSGVAIITGATSGIGKAFAWHYAKAGHDVVLVARRQGLLNQLAHELHQETGIDAATITADLSTTEGIQRVCQRLDNTDNPARVLVHAAGYGLGSRFTDNAIEIEQAGLRVMVEATMQLNYHAAQVMRKQRHGAIINISSMASRMTSGTYSAHKAWVLAFTLALHDELHDDGVRALAVTPGPVHTEFFRNAGIKEESMALPDAMWVDADTVVHDTLQALNNDQAQVTPGILPRTAMGLMRLLPTSAIRTISRRGAHL